MAARQVGPNGEQNIHQRKPSQGKGISNQAVITEQGDRQLADAAPDGSLTEKKDYGTEADMR